MKKICYLLWRFWKGQKFSGKEFYFFLFILLFPFWSKSTSSNIQLLFKFLSTLCQRCYFFFFFFCLTLAYLTGTWTWRQKSLSTVHSQTLCPWLDNCSKRKVFWLFLLCSIAQKLELPVTAKHNSVAHLELRRARVGFFFLAFSYLIKIQKPVQHNF